MADPSRVRISGVLQPFAVGFAAELARQGYTPRSLQTQLYLMAHVSRWLHAKDLDLADFPAQTQPFLQARQEAGYKQHLTGKALRPLVTYLRDAVRPFLCRYVSTDGLALDVDQLSEAGVTAFMVTRCAEQSRRAAQLTATALRSLVGFLHVTGMITHALAAAVPSVAGRRLAGLPPRLDPDHVQRLLAVCDRRTLGGLRDFAVITTLVRLPCAPPKWRPCASTTCSGVLERSSCTARDTGPSACP